MSMGTWLREQKVNNKVYWTHPETTPERFDSLLQIAVDFESFLEPADSRICGAQCEMFKRSGPKSSRS
jgi:hypothetical protein